jgi:hypothetical protein
MIMIMIKDFGHTELCFSLFAVDGPANLYLSKEDLTSVFDIGV